MIDYADVQQDIINHLESLEKNLQVKAVRAGLRQGSAPLKSNMKQNAPSRSGRLAASVTHNILSGKKRDTAHMLAGIGKRETTKLAEDQQAVVVGPNRKVKGINPSYYGHILEHGAKSHTIQLRKKGNAKTLRMSKTGSTSTSFFFRDGKVAHPGLSGLGWMSESYDQSYAQVTSGFYQGMSRYLDKVH